MRVLAADGFSRATRAARKIPANYDYGPGACKRDFFHSSARKLKVCARVCANRARALSTWRVEDPRARRFAQIRDSFAGIFDSTITRRAGDKRIICKAKKGKGKGEAEGGHRRLEAVRRRFHIQKNAYP